MERNSLKRSSIDLKENELKKKINPIFNKSWDVYVYSLCLFGLGFNYAMVTSLYAPAMIDFKYVFHTTLNAVSFANVFRMIGYLVGCQAGFFYTRINRQCVMAVGIIGLGLFTAVTPFCSEVWQVYLFTLLSNIGVGVWDCGNDVWLIEMWGLNSPSILQLSKTINGVGVILAPILDEPFLVGELKVNNLTQFNHNKTAIDIANEQLNYSIDRRSKLKLPFVIGGCTAIPAPLVVLVMFLIKRYRPPSAKISDQTIDSQKPVLSAKVKYSLIALISMSLSSYGAMEIVQLSYSSTYYQDLPIHLSAQRAAEILSLSSAMLTLGKLLSAFISIKLKPELMIAYSFVILAISLAIMYFGSNNEPAIWIGNALIGAGFSASWAAYFSLANNQFDLTTKITSIFLSVSVICPIIAPFLCGPLIEKNPQIFLLAQLIFFVITIILFILIIIILKLSARSSNSKISNNNNNNAVLNYK